MSHDLCQRDRDEIVEELSVAEAEFHATLRRYGAFVEWRSAQMYTDLAVSIANETRHADPVRANPDLDVRPRWSTSSFGDPADTSPVELAALGRHLSRCTGRRGVLSALRGVGRAVDRFAAPRVMTTLMLFALLAVIASLVI